RLIVVVVNGEGGIIAEAVDVRPQDAYAHGVESADPGPAGIASRQLINPLAHLSGCLDGKGDGKELLRTNAYVADEMGYAVGNDPRLARSGPGDDQHGALRLENGFPLLFVQSCNQ